MNATTDAARARLEEKERVWKLAQQLAKDLFDSTEQLLRATCCEEDLEETRQMFLQGARREAATRLEEHAP